MEPGIRHQPLTLRLRLTLWYAAVLAGIIALFGMAVYGLMVFNLIRQLDRSLSGTAEGVIRASSLRSFLDLRVIDLPRLEGFGTAQVFVQVWYVDGPLAASSGNFGYTEPLDPGALERDDETHRDVYVDNYHLWVVTKPIRVNNQIVGYVQAAAPLDLVDQATNTLVIVLVTGGVAAVVLAALVGWLAAHRALKPLDTITQTALQITRADDLSRRIPIAPGAPQDEVGRLAQAFNESLERLERLFHAQRRFLADVSHELRTPLTVIRGNVDLLRRMGGADPDSLDAIQSEAERMSRLVGDLLLLAQAEAGTLPMARNLVELDTLLLEVYRESQVLAGGVSIGIGEIDQAPVIGDRDRLKQLVLNLVSNAIKYTPEGGRVTLGLARVNDWARLVVSDTGIGIPADELPHIFDRFYRVDKARTRSQGGAGLGLAIAQRIAQMHGGRIEAASDGTHGRGSTFSLWLPMAADKANLTANGPNGSANAGRAAEIPAPALAPIKKAGS